VVVQGTGKVGTGLVRLLAEEGARLSIADLDANAVDALAKQTGAEIIPSTDALTEPCDILAPCALGPVVTDDTLKTFRCKAIAGAANNQLERPDHGRALEDAGIVYAPDYVINAGGLINVAGEVLGFGHDQARTRAEGIAETLATIFARASDRGTSPAEEADRLAEERIGSAKRGYAGPGGSR
jgi:leucine dehydrogenase